MRRALVAAALAVVLATGACSDGDGARGDADPDRIVLGPAAEGADHTHAPGQEHGGAPVGDGTTAEAGGYALVDVRLPDADRPGEMSFRVLDDRGEVVTSYTEEQTKLLHLYVVRGDLSAFRHLHPALGDDGTWRAQVDLGEPGPWRVVAEFAPQGATRPVVLGTTVRVPGRWTPVEVARGTTARTGDDAVVRARLLEAGSVGDDGRLRIVVTDLEGRPLTLGSYLGAAAHLTGFTLPDAGGEGGFVHVHPYGAPEVTEEGTVLTFHTTFTTPGDYRLFLQVRVEGLLHQVALTATVEG